MLLSPFSFELRLVVRLGVNCPELQLTQLAISLMRFTAHSFPLHGSSVIWCLSRIPHYPFILDFFKSSGELRLGTVAARLVAKTAIAGCLCVVAMSMKELPVIIGILSALRFWDSVVNFQHIVFTEKQIAVGAFSFLPFEQFSYLSWHFWVIAHSCTLVDHIYVVG
jgi:hypothetical protein